MPILVFYLFIYLFLTISTSLSHDIDPLGYIAYCPCMGRFGNQADHFLGALGFAHGLNRTLILPPWVEYRYGEPRSIQVPFDKYFKVAPLSKFHKVVTMDKFMEEIAPVEWPPSKRISFCYISRGNGNDCNAKEGNPFGPFWDTFEIDFVGSEFYNPLHYDTYHHNMAKQWLEKYPPAKFPVLAFTGAPASFPVQRENLHLQKYLQWSDEVSKKVDNFIEKTLPNGAFIAIHLRNGVDWVKACEHIPDSPNLFAAPQCLGYMNEKGKATTEMCLPSKQTIIRQLKRVIKKASADNVIKSIFVSSDNNHMIEDLNEALKRIKIQAFKYDKNDPHVDLAIMGRANFFIEILVYTVATSPTDGYARYLSSAHTYNIHPTILGFGEAWKGGADIRNQPGGGWKVNLVKQALEPHKDTSKIILFTDAYDVIFLDNLNAIIEKFKKFNARVLFGAESACWPDVELARKYPEVTEGKRFLNSGLYIGYAKELWELLNFEEVEDEGDDQLFFTKAYLDEVLRKKIGFQLDHKSELFQNLNGAVNEVEAIEVKAKEGPEEYKVKNVIYHTEPLILHGNGPSKLALNYLGNYLAKSWNSVEGCVTCKENHVNLINKKVSEMPKVFLALFIELNTPFLEEQLNKLHKQEYPKKRIDLFVHNAMKYHSSVVKEFIEKHGSEYNSIKEIIPEDGSTEWAARDLSLDQCLAKGCDYYVSVDSIAHLDNPHTIRLLIEQNRTFVAPMLVRPGKAWSNFWGALTKDGFYARSNDYMDIVHNDKRGLWNVPFVGNCYVINATLLKKYDRRKLNFNKPSVDPDMAFCSNLRDLDVFMYVSNRVDFGHLANPETFDITRTEPEMYQIFDNEGDWEERYIHPDYPENFNPDKKNEQPCPDVYWFPIVNPRFCNSLINMMENFGKWSDGSNQDSRLEGGYEAVPTRDIHMNQVGWDRHWLEFLRKYVRPLQEHVFLGYFHDPPRSLMNFVVRYKPGEQPSLRPHHDSSTYTINIALNRKGIDYEGGGCRFIRYNCSVVDTKQGWLLMHPGRLTHYHEGLLVTKGIRYIMISFVDP